MLGVIYPERSMILRIACGTAEYNGKTYELNTTLDGRLCIHSETTGKYYLLPWKDLLGLAIEAGIDDPEAPHGA